jgi:hypothetical protein
MGNRNLSVVADVAEVECHCRRSCFWLAAANFRDIGGLAPTAPHGTPVSSNPKVWIPTQWYPHFFQFHRSRWQLRVEPSISILER